MISLKSVDLNQANKKITINFETVFEPFGSVCPVESWLAFVSSICIYRSTQCSTASEDTVYLTQANKKIIINFEYRVFELFASVWST